MAKWIVGSGLDDYIAELQKIGKDTDKACGSAVYAMAAVVADEVRKNIAALPAVPDTDGLKAYQEKTDTQLTIKQKKGLLDGFGISREQTDNGYRHVKLGFDGYNDIQTRTYPNGQPNALIARATESGSSVRKKTPFIRPAVNRAKKQAIEAGQKAIDETIYSI